MKKILKFYSESCAPCKVMSNKLKGLDVEVKDIDIADGDNIDVCNKYSIRTVPTIIVLDENDELVSTFKGIVPIEDIKKALK